MKNTIFILVVLPIRKNRWKFYINTNLKDSHSLNRDKLQNFLKKSINPILYNECIYYLDRFLPFIIDVKNKTIKRLRLNYKKTIEKLKYDKTKEIYNPDVIKKKLHQIEKNEFYSICDKNSQLVKRYYKKP